MANISQIQVGGTTYDICDSIARDSISSFQIIMVANKNSFSINANGSFIYSYSLDDLNFNSSYFIMSLMGIVNNHPDETTTVGWGINLVTRRVVRIDIRNMYSNSFTFGAGNLIVHLLISNNSLFKPSQDTTIYSVADAG